MRYSCAENDPTNVLQPLNKENHEVYVALQLRSSLRLFTLRDNGTKSMELSQSRDLCCTAVQLEVRR